MELLTIDNRMRSGELYRLLHPKVLHTRYIYTRKFTRRASKRRCVHFAVVWREPGVIIRRVLFGAGWWSLASSAIIYNIVKMKVPC